MSNNEIQLTVADGIARLTFDQPDRPNVLTAAFLTELGASLDALVHLPGITGLILESAKTDVFSAGADLNELACADPANPEPMRALVALALRVFATLELLPFPTVAAIDGAALGGGLEVALACDFRVCGSSPQLQLGLPEIKVGLIPAGGGTQRLTRLVGVEEAIGRIISGESYDATDPPSEDLIDETVPSADLLACARRWLATGDWQEMRQLKRSPASAHLLPSADFLTEIRYTLDEIDEPLRPAALASIKVIMEGALGDLAAGLRLETEAFLKLAGSAVSRQLIGDFLARRQR
jgi:enoyl-CoA hydratase/carnithine racemase